MGLEDRDGVIWMDGEYVDWREAKTHVLTHTLHYGLGVFEGIRAYETERGPAVFRLHSHTDRLFKSAHILAMPIPFSQEQINDAILTVIKKNQLKSAYIRPMCFYGSEGMGLRADNLKVHVTVAAWVWGTYMGEENLKRGVRLMTSSFTRHHVNAIMCRAKANGHYINSMMALREALAAGYDEALMLDAQGYVAEGTGENIFLVSDGKLLTPALTSALDGITRDSVIRLAGEMGIPVMEKSITRDEVYIADEAFFTGTAAEVVPIRELDGRQIGDGGRGPVTTRIQSAYFDIVYGRSEKHKAWLTPIE